MSRPKNTRSATGIRAFDWSAGVTAQDRSLQPREGGKGACRALGKLGEIDQSLIISLIISSDLICTSCLGNYRLPRIASRAFASKRSFRSEKSMNQRSLQDHIRTIALSFVFIGSFSVLVSTADAQVFSARWWEFIHCHGSQDHRPSQPVPSTPEVFSDDGFDYNQCHGGPGQRGSCHASDTAGNSWSVSCSPIIGMCFAVMNCSGGGTLSCQTPTGGAFAGTQSGNALDHALVHCEGVPSTEGSKSCNSING